MVPLDTSPPVTRSTTASAPTETTGRWITSSVSQRVWTPSRSSASSVGCAGRAARAMSRNPQNHAHAVIPPLEYWSVAVMYAKETSAEANRTSPASRTARARSPRRVMVITDRMTPSMSRSPIG